MCRARSGLASVGAASRWRAVLGSHGRDPCSVALMQRTTAPLRGGCAGRRARRWLARIGGTATATRDGAALERRVSGGGEGCRQVGSVAGGRRSDLLRWSAPSRGPRGGRFPADEVRRGWCSKWVRVTLAGEGDQFRFGHPNSRLLSGVVRDTCTVALRRAGSRVNWRAPPVAIRSFPRSEPFIAAQTGGSSVEIHAVRYPSPNGAS